MSRQAEYQAEEYTAEGFRWCVYFNVVGGIAVSRAKSGVESDNRGVEECLGVILEVSGGIRSRVACESLSARRMKEEYKR